MLPTPKIASAYRQLQPSERAFVDGYVTWLEGEALARHERISHTLERPVTADMYVASRGYLDRALVKAAIHERVTEIAAQTELNVPRLVREYMGIAFSTFDNFGVRTASGMNWDLTLATPEQFAAVQYIEQEEKTGFDGSFTRKLKIKMHPKQPALDKIAEYMGMFAPENPHYRAYEAKPVEAVALPASTTDEAAAEAYQRIAYAAA